MPNDKSPDLLNTPVDVAVELARMLEDGLPQRLGAPEPVDPVRQWLKDHNVRMKTLRGQ